MARCDEGYHCDVCGLDVELIVDSELYLRYILGEILLEAMHRHSERHIRCNPSIAQFIVDPLFDPVTCEGPFAKSELPADYVASEEQRITRGWRRLQAIPTLGLSIPEYPLHITPDT